MDQKNKQLDAYRVNNSAKGCPMTSNFGVKVGDDDNSLKASAKGNGPTLIEDFHFREKITHFDHERIPERVVHARGSGAHGFFQVYESQEKITKAKFLCDVSVRTPVFVRFSTVLGSRGSADTVRDVRGFAVKFYTTEGNFDLVGNNIPVFFIQDALKFPDIIHAGKPEPDREIPQGATAHDNFWDIIWQMPEATHMSLWALSDRAIPRSYRMMEGFGVHSFVFVNADGVRRFVKFHWKPLLGVHSLAWDEAQKLAGQDPDFHRRDLWDAIDSGSFPEWELGVQIVEEKDEHSFDFDILDSTKIIPEELVPVQRIGKLTLNRNPTDFFAETEQVAFCTQHVVPGIDFSDDPLLQGRNFSYQDTQLTRLGGPNWQELPINRPLCPVINNQRDGFMRQTIGASKINYWPNRQGHPHPASQEQGGFFTYAEKLNAIKERARSPKFLEHFNQATLFYNSLSQPEKEHLIMAAQFELGKCDEREVQERMVERYVMVNPDLAAKIAEGLGFKPPTPAAGWENHGKISPSVSQENTVKGSIATRRIGCIVFDGFDSKELQAMRAAIKGAGGMTFVIAPRKGAVYDNSGKEAAVADFTLLTSKSTLFDAIFVVGGEAHLQKKLEDSGDVIAFVNEAFKHCKPICGTGNAVEFIRSSCTLPEIKLATKGDPLVNDLGVVTCLDSNKNLAGEFIGAIGQHRFWTRKISKVPA